MKGAEAYVNDQWNSCGLADLPQGSEALRVTLHFVVPRDAQTTALIERIAEAARQHLCEAYPGRPVHAEPTQGSVIGDGSGDGIELSYRVDPASA
ncbi:hypothetical protein [Stutzerimonas azotifigens]|uniref:hypothetical protein n=1 Tax=Stutzerimonas azotifigens TaxID=291995 RepID=UPI0004132E46|nr:hypothetical protein [Stutzerimonas azotifigens]